MSVDLQDKAASNQNNYDEQVTLEREISKSRTNRDHHLNRSKPQSQQQSELATPLMSNRAAKSTKNYINSLSMIGQSSLQNPIQSQSASTLQHSTSTLTFPKAERFSRLQLMGGLGSDVSLPSSLRTNGTSLGFGSKIVMSDTTTKEMKNYPAPNRYKLKSVTDLALEKKFTFGLPRSAFTKSWLPGQTSLPPELTAEFPGPGAYEVVRSSTHDPKITLKSKGKMFNEQVEDKAPAANYYTPKMEITENKRYSGVTFGHGSKLDFTKTGNRNPGPGSYRIPSAFDKYDKNHYTNSWKRKTPLNFNNA